MGKKYAWFIIVLILLIATVSASTLNRYPDLFVSGNQLDLKIVVSGNGNTEEVLAGTDIASSIINHYNEYNANLDSGSPGDTEQMIIGEGRDLLELYELIGNVKESLTYDDFENLLSRDRISTSEGSTDVFQYLRFEDSSGSIESGKVVFDEYDNEVSDYLLFNDGAIIFELEIEFEDGLESDIKDDRAEDAEGETINILGSDYSILEMEIDDNRIEMKLLRQNAELLLVEGQPATVVIGDKTFVIEAITISDSAEEVIFSINGERTDAMEEGDSTLTDEGLTIGIKDLLINEAAESSSDVGGSEIVDTSLFEGMTVSELSDYLAETSIITGGRDLVTITIGVSLIEFVDDYTDDKFSNSVHINGDRVSEGSVSIEGTKDGNNFQLDRIRYRAKAEPKSGNDVYIPAGDTLSEYIDDPNVLLSNWDIRYLGLSEEDTTEVYFDPRGDETYELIFTNNDNQECEIPLVDNSDDNGLGFNLGDETDDLNFIECAAGTYCVVPETYLVLTTRNDRNGDTYIVQYDSIDTNGNSITLKDLCDDETFEASYSGDEGVDAKGTINVRGASFDFEVGPGTDDNSIAVDLNDDDTIDNGESKVIVKDGLIIDLGTTNSPAPAIDAGFDITFTVEEALFDEDGPFDEGGPEVVTINILNRADNKVGISLEDQTHLFLETGSDNDVEEGMTPYGVYYKLTDEGSDAEELLLEFPEQQLGAKIALELYPTSSVSLISEIDISLFSANPTIEDDELFNVNDNLIVVGTPCTNTAASLLLGDPSSCSSIIEKPTLMLFETAGKYQLLVTGKDSSQVREAADVLIDFEMQPLSGEIIEIDNGILSTISYSDWQARQITVPPLEEQPITPPPPVTPPPADVPFTLPPEPTPEPTPEPEEEKSNVWLWIILGLILIIGGAIGVYLVMQKAHKEKIDTGIPEGYTPEQWKKALTYYKENYPEWYGKYMAWKEKKMPKGNMPKETMYIVLLIAVTLVGLAMIITVSLPGNGSGLDSDVVGQAYAGTEMIICSHQMSSAQFRISPNAPENTFRNYLCTQYGPWDCNYRGGTQFWSCY